MTRTAADWFATMQDATAGAKERIQFSEWLAESPRHVEDYLSVAALWRSLAHTASAQLSEHELLAAARDEREPGNVVALGPVRARDVVPQRPDTPSTGFRPGALRLAALAASLAVLAFSAWLASDRFLGERYSTDIGEQVTFTLEDGSTVRLNTQSTIRVRMRENERLIGLVEGEALFEVAKDARRPFRVNAGGALVEAIGTVFNVNRGRAATTVTVLEGRVRVSAPQDTRADVPPRGKQASSPDAGLRVAEISARDRAQVTSDGYIVTEHEVSLERELAWTDRRLVFHAETLDAVAQEFNRYNRLRLEITDPSLAALRISGNFNATDPRSLVQYLEEAEDVSVEHSGDVLRLSR